MNKQEFIMLVDSLNMPKDKYLIASGGVLLMMGIRDKATDLDMCITPTLFADFKTRYDVKKSDKPFDNLYYINDLIEFFVNENGEELDTNLVDGYPCERLESVLKYKEIYHRPKDLIDIENIKRYLKRTI